MSTIDTFHGTRSGGAEATIESRLSRLVTAVTERLAEMGQKRRSRRMLLEMSDAQLKDIGISRADAYREASRPFWD